MTRTPKQRLPQIDHIALEQEARRLRAEAFGRAVSALFRRIARRRGLQGEPA
mgnify:CR=1 FL=1